MSTGAESGSPAAAVLAPLCAISGAVVLSGFFFQSYVGETISGGAWLTVALVFFSSGLGYLAVLPHSSSEEGETTEDPYLLRVRRRGVREMLRGFLARQELVTLASAVAVFALFFVLQAAFPDGTSGVVDDVTNSILQVGGPVFLLAVLVSVCYCFLLLLGPWGDIKLGGPDTDPAYTFPTYFTLIFTAGIAAGVVFWGPAEALSHYQDPPPYFGAAPESSAAIGGALTYALSTGGCRPGAPTLSSGCPSRTSCSTAVPRCGYRRFSRRSSASRGLTPRGANWSTRSPSSPSLAASPPPSPW